MWTAGTFFACTHSTHLTLDVGDITLDGWDLRGLLLLAHSRHLGGSQRHEEHEKGDSPGHHGGFTSSTRFQKNSSSCRYLDNGWTFSWVLVGLDLYFVFSIVERCI